MEKKSFEKTIKDGVRLLEKYLPQKTYLYFPLLSAAIIWALRRSNEWKKKIFAWEVWIDPEPVKEKPDRFVINFFENHPSLSKVYADELEKDDMRSLRKAFDCLYPVVGLEDPFLSALFQKELRAKKYRRIVKDFGTKVKLAKEDIDSVKDKSKLLRSLRAFAEEMVSFGKDYIMETDVQKAIAEILEGKSNDEE